MGFGYAYDLIQYDKVNAEINRRHCLSPINLGTYTQPSDKKISDSGDIRYRNG